MLLDPWSIRLMGTFKVYRQEQEILRFQTQKTGELLAYLAYYPQRNHLREALMEMLWPEVEPGAGRNRLKQALASLRRQLEPPGVAQGSVLIADRNYLRLNDAAIDTDVQQFQAAIKACSRVEDPYEKTEALLRAVTCYQGELLPGIYSDWLVQERSILNETYLASLRQLIDGCDRIGDLQRAIQYTELLVSRDSLNEAAHQRLIRFYIEAGQPAAALQQYRNLENLLAREMGVMPSAATAALISALRGSTPIPTLSPVHKQKVQSKEGEAIPMPPYPLLSPAFPQTVFSQTASAPFQEAGSSPRLPVALTRFIGRQAEIAQLVARLLPQTAAADVSQEEFADAPARLITLTGPGGIGKTRLALAIAERLESYYQDAIWFISLEDLSEPHQIWDALITKLQLRHIAPISPQQQVIEALNRRPALLLFDHCDSIQEAGELVQMLLAQVPSLTCLTTASRRLQIEGEQAFITPTLPTPPEEISLEQLFQYDSVRLFVSRAQTVQSDFQLTPDNAPTIGALCRKLEGLPLAIELAAGWAQVLSTSQILERMTDRFELLVSRKKGGTPRHQSLRAALDNNYAQLSLSERRMLSQLSVFHGGWTLEEASAVCDAPEIIDLLTQLRNHSLVLAGEIQGEMRFYMLETVAEYAGSKLSPAERDALACRHALFFLAYAEDAVRRLQGAEQALWLEKLERDHANLLAAVRWLHTWEAGLEAELRLIVALARFWWMRGHLDEGVSWLRIALERSEQASHPVRARILLGASYLAYYRSDFKQAWEWSEESIRLSQEMGPMPELCDAMALLASNPLVFHENISLCKMLLQSSKEQSRSLGYRNGVAFALIRQGIVAWSEGDMQRAQDLLGQGLDLNRELKDLWGTAGALSEIVAFAIWRAEYVYASRLLEEQLTLGRKLGSPLVTAQALWQQGTINRCLGDTKEADRCLQESLQIRRALQDKKGVADALSSLGMTAYAQGDYDSARTLQEESLSLRRQLGEKIITTTSVEQLAWIALAQSDISRARSLFEESLAIFRANRFKPGIAGALHGLGLLNYRSGLYEMARKLLEESLSLRKALEDKKGMIECLEALARVFQAQRQQLEAIHLLAFTSAFRTALRLAPTAAERFAHDNALRVAKTALPEAVFQNTWETGEAQTLEEALGSVLE